MKKQTLAKQVVAAVSSGAMSDAQAAAHWSLDVRTVRSWVKKYPHLHEAPRTKKLVVPLSPESPPPPEKRTMTTSIFINSLKMKSVDGLEAALCSFTETATLVSMGQKVAFKLHFNDLTDRTEVMSNEICKEIAVMVYRATRLLAFISGQPVFTYYQNGGNQNDVRVFDILSRLDKANPVMNDSGFGVMFGRPQPGGPAMVFGTSDKLSKLKNVVSDADVARAHVDLRQRCSDTYQQPSNVSVLWANSGRNTMVKGSQITVGHVREFHHQVILTLRHDNTYDVHLAAPRATANSLPALPPNP